MSLLMPLRSIMSDSVLASSGTCARARPDAVRAAPATPTPARRNMSRREGLTGLNASVEARLFTNLFMAVLLHECCGIGCRDAGKGGPLQCVSRPRRMQDGKDVSNHVFGGLQCVMPRIVRRGKT